VKKVVVFIMVFLLTSPTLAKNSEVKPSISDAGEFCYSEGFQKTAKYKYLGHVIKPQFTKDYKRASKIREYINSLDYDFRDEGEDREKTQAFCRKVQGLSGSYVYSYKGKRIDNVNSIEKANKRKAIFDVKREKEAERLAKNTARRNLLSELYSSQEKLEIKIKESRAIVNGKRPVKSSVYIKAKRKDGIFVGHFYNRKTVFISDSTGTIKKEGNYELELGEHPAKATLTFTKPNGFDETYNIMAVQTVKQLEFELWKRSDGKALLMSITDMKKELQDLNRRILEVKS
jgi:hypothetical protein